MNNPLQSVKIERYKGINEATFDAEAINVLIGANNSGKSSIAQIIHFGISVLQSIGLNDGWSRGAASISPIQLHYSPCVDLYALGHKKRLVESESSAISLSLTLSDGELIKITIRKGRNDNINVRFSNANAAKSIAVLEKPYTIYSPGLAGIARSEEYVSNGVLLRTIARGDANLVLRNILLRLSNRKEDWDSFIEDLRRLFGEIDISVDFKSDIDEHILVSVNNANSNWVPIELAGTGVLQSVQILGYVHYFHPSVILLDEPDSHLHPNNQRLLCKLLQGVAEDRDTQVFLTTHSRHVVDALTGQAAFIWVRNGTVEKMTKDHDLAVLMDIGALDIKEMISEAKAKCIVLTEDSLKQGLELLLEGSGITMSDTIVLAYHGCTSPHNLRPLLELIRGSNSSAKIVVHRDRDYLNNSEAEEWKKNIRNMNAEPFLTANVDVEGYFLNAKHLSEINSQSESDILDIINEATTQTTKTSIEKYVNGRSDIMKKAGNYRSLNIGELAAEAPDTVNNDIERYRHSKTVLKKVRKIYQEKYGKNLRTMKISSALLDPELYDISKKI